MLELIAIKSKNGLYISDNVSAKASYFSSQIPGYYFNGKQAERTFDADWFFIDAPTVEKVEKKLYLQRINKRFELSDTEMASSKIPSLIEYDEAMDDDGDMKPWFESIHSLYVEKWDTYDPGFEEIEFTMTTVLEMDSLVAPKSFEFSAMGDREQYKVDRTYISHPSLYKILYPSLVIHATPCALRSKEVYDILRDYIKRNIDVRYAVITSDYNFCFTVEKVIKLENPYSIDTTVQITKRKTESRKKFINNRKVVVFEMTYYPENYQGYTPISDIVADNEDELAEKMEKLCLDTIAKINAPLIDCPHCDGTGVVLEN
jgi:hypothetical protein